MASDREGEWSTTGTGIGEGVYVGNVDSTLGEGTKKRTMSYIKLI